MIECSIFILQCTTIITQETTAYYLYSLSDLLTSESEVKRQKLIECVLSGNSKQHLGKEYTEEQIKELSTEEVDKLFSNYEAKLLGQMVKSLGKSIIKMYLIRACAVLGMRNHDALSKDLESDPFLNSTLQRFTCELYYRFGSFFAPLIIVSKHCLSELGNKNGETNGGTSREANGEDNTE